MAIKIIRKEGDPVLRQTAKAVPEVTKHIHKLLDDMADTMYDAPGVGLAAPQIGISKRVIVCDVGEGLIELINPEVQEVSGQQTGPEGCLSIPGIEADVTRPYKAVVKGWNRNQEEILVEGEGLLARCLLHEIDHLNGILFTDLVTQIRQVRQTQR